MNDFQYDEDDILIQLQAEIAKQVVDEMDNGHLKKETKEKKPSKKSRKKTNIKIFTFTLVLSLVIIGGSAFAFANNMLGKMNYEDADKVKRIRKNESGIEEKAIDLSKAGKFVGSDKHVINILLIGEEAMADSNRGRSDSMIVVTINQDEKSLKLTSFMRDTYVAIPGYKNNKLNSAYNSGGGPLVCETLRKNFNIGIDGYARVNFDGFEKIIDKLGGVEITLTRAEAAYLNKTNYISKKKYRHVKEGKQILNGNQALGYSRVRYVSGITKERDDFGRTSRQRIVLNAIFEKYKHKNIVELVDLANDILPMISTNMKKKEMMSYLTSAVTLKVDKLDTLRIPVDNGYFAERVNFGSTSSEVLIPDLGLNNKKISLHIYGEEN